MSGLARAVDGWSPAPVETADQICAAPARALAGLLDQPPPEDVLPPLWHWLYFLDRPAQRELGPDGHPQEGHFLPPIPERRRMFAGARWTCGAPIRFGEVVRRRSELVAVNARNGRSGELLFTTVRHAFVRGDGEPAGVEEQDIVYRSGTPGPTVPPPPLPEVPAPGPWRFDMVTDSVLLFRFSALTYNAHRIHYDAEYAVETEAHAGLVVHGPLLAILLAELPRRAGHAFASLTFRARAPLHAGRSFVVTGGPGEELRIVGPGGHAAMTMNLG
ncbi:hypothetical protein [Spirillospora sp. CA-294931]|uniref:hypothetical protein n=1 Tax=Spirillospora sp. CA-294931 TaxID=3240042 RepID=UPI003D89BF9A